MWLNVSIYLFGVISGMISGYFIFKPMIVKNTIRKQKVKGQGILKTVFKRHKKGKV